MPDARSVDGSSVAVLPSELSVKVEVVSVAGSIGSEKVGVTLALGATFVAALEGLMLLTVGAVVSLRGFMATS